MPKIGKGGYDYQTYSEMRSLIMEETGKSSIYFEVYEEIMRRYKTADPDRTEILPFEVLTYSDNYFVYLIVLVALFVWRTTGTLQFAGSEISSFLNNETSVMPLTYGRLIIYFIITAYLLTLGTASIIFYLSSHSTNAINMLIKAVPVLIVGCMLGLFMQGAFRENSSIYNLLPVPYCELMIALIVFVVGLFLNFGNYRALRQNDC